MTRVDRPDDRPAHGRVRGDRAGPQLQGGDQKIAGIVLTSNTPLGWFGGLTVAGGVATLLVIALTWLFLKGVGIWGVTHSGRVGIRHHQLRVVDRYRPRGHADLGDSAAVQADVAQLDQSVRRGDDDLRGSLRGHVPADPRGASVGKLLAIRRVEQVT